MTPQDLEEIAVHIAGEISAKVGYNGPLIRDELLKFQSLIKSMFVTNVNDGVEEIVTHTTDGTIRSHEDLKNELYSLVDKLSL